MNEILIIMITQTHGAVGGGGGPGAGKSPGRLGDKGGKGEPVVVPVPLQVRERDEQEAVQQSAVTCAQGVIPDLVGVRIEQLGLVCRPEVLDRVVVLEHAARDDAVGVRGADIERVCADSDGAAEIDGLAGLSVRDRSADRVGGGDVDGVVGEAQLVDLEVGEGVPEGGLDQGRKGDKLEHGRGGAVTCAPRCCPPPSSPPPDACHPPAPGPG